jgi:hypothetical protein
VEEERRGKEKYIDGCLMVKVVNGGFPGLAQLVAIFTIQFIRMFFDFKDFTNEMGAVMWSGG